MFLWIFRRTGAAEGVYLGGAGKRRLPKYYLEDLSRMPPIRSIAVNNGEIRWTDASGVERTFTPGTLPSNLTIPQAEAWINSWLASRITGYQMVVHIFSLSPLHLTTWCGDLDVPVPSNWWEEN